MSRSVSRVVRAAFGGLTVFGFLALGSAHYQAVPEHDTHIVGVGESLSSVAAAHNVSADQIIAANGLSDLPVLYAGNQLRLQGPSFVIGSAEVSHVTVGERDSLVHFASHAGVSAHDLAHLNSLSETAVLEAGAVLHVPGPSWRCPVEGAGYFNDWGFPRSSGRFHTGTDLFAPRGTPVRAPVSGDLVQRTGSIGGHQFELLGDDGNLYLGSHMDQFGASGEVDAGEVIGYVGDSGNAQGSEPHLHFEIHPGGGIPVNPYPSLRAGAC